MRIPVGLRFSVTIYPEGIDVEALAIPRGCRQRTVNAWKNAISISVNAWRELAAAENVLPRPTLFEGSFDEPELAQAETGSAEGT